MAQAIIHLDTSFLIRALNASSGEDKQLRRWMADGVKLGMSAIGWAEFLCGPLDQRQLALAAAIVGEPEPFVEQDSIQTAGAVQPFGTAPRLAFGLHDRRDRDQSGCQPRDRESR